MLKTLGLVLKKQSLGETDRIITILTPNLGKKRVIARAVRRPLSKLAGHLDTLMISQLMLTDEPDLPKVTSAVLTESFNHLRDSFELTSRALWVTKIIERVSLEDVSQRPLFRLSVETLARINQNRPWLITWLKFLSELTDQLGLGPNDFRCQNCQKLVIEDADWIINDRRLRCLNCLVSSELKIRLKKNSVKLLQLLIRQPFDQLVRIQVPAQVGQRVEEIFLREVTQWLNWPWQAYSQLSKEE